MHRCRSLPCPVATPTLVRPIRRSSRRRSFEQDRKSTRLNSSHVAISYAVFCLKKKKKKVFVSVFIKGSGNISKRETRQSVAELNRSNFRKMTESDTT